MKVKIKVEKEMEIKLLQVSAGVRYWEDTTVNGEEDKNGDKIPCRRGQLWEPIIDIDYGQIVNWKRGTTADIHYKVCDAGTYKLLDTDKNEIVHIEGYVPDIMCPEGGGYGDYIIMKVDENGFIANWDNDISDLLKEND